MDMDGPGSGTLLQQLPPALQLHILSLLPPNDRALSGCLVSPDAADALAGPDHCSASLSQPLPPHAAPWAVEAGQQHVRQLPFRHKLQLLCTAAASGSEVNLEVALALLQPSIFPELLHNLEGAYTRQGSNADPGVVAVKAGHPQLLGWLLHHCPALLQPNSVLQAAAQYCDLAGLQTMWEPMHAHLKRGNGGRGILTNRPGPHQLVLDAAVASATPDGAEKVQWLLAACNGSCKLQESTALAAVQSGSLGQLQWLHSLGCPMGGEEVLSCALQHAGLALVQWLVDEAGCELPAAAEGGADSCWGDLFRSAVGSPDGVEKLAWLQQRGAPSPPADLVEGASHAGQAGVANFLLQAPGAMAVLQARKNRLGRAAVSSHSVPTAELLRKAGARFTPEAYGFAAGSLAMTRWLACHAEVPPASFALDELTSRWPRGTPAHSRDLLKAVQLLMTKGGHRLPYITYKPALATAANRGDVALVQYLLQQQQQLRNGQPEFQPDWEFLTAAAESGCEALLEWLVKEHPGCLEVAGSHGTPYGFAARNGDRGTLTTLRRLGVPWGAGHSVVRELSTVCRRPVRRWLEEQGAPMGSAER